jgi:hypothetical protein
MGFLLTQTLKSSLPVCAWAEVIIAATRTTILIGSGEIVISSPSARTHDQAARVFRNLPPHGRLFNPYSLFALRCINPLTRWNGSIVQPLI